MTRTQIALFSLCLVVGLALAGLAGSPTAQADIGVVGAKPNSGEAGREVELTIGCGACKSIYIVDGRGHPPKDLPVSLVPLAKAPQPGPCGEGRGGLCAPEVLGPPRRPPFVFLGRAQPRFREAELAQIPRPEYRLRFRIPDVEPGVYTFVVYCADCHPGPRGSLIADPVARRWRLWVRPHPEHT